MVNPYDTIHDLNAYCEGLERRLFAIKAQCAEWERVFGHLGDTPDECGNAIIAKRDELEERCDVLTAALTDLLNDLEDRAKWNLEESQRVVACGNGVYMRAKAALEELK